MFLWGLGAVGALNLLLVSSLSFVRNRVYNLFFTLHVVCVVATLVAVRHSFFFGSQNIDWLSDVQTCTNYFAVHTSCNGPHRLRSPRPLDPDTLRQGMAHRRACTERWHNALACSFPWCRLACGPACPFTRCQQRVVRLVDDLALWSRTTVHHGSWIRFLRHRTFNQGAGLLEPQSTAQVRGSGRCTPQRAIYRRRARTRTLTRGPCYHRGSIW